MGKHANKSVLKVQKVTRKSSKRKPLLISIFCLFGLCGLITIQITKPNFFSIDPSAKINKVIFKQSNDIPKSIRSLVGQVATKKRSNNILSSATFQEILNIGVFKSISLKLIGPQTLFIQTTLRNPVLKTTRKGVSYGIENDGDIYITSKEIKSNIPAVAGILSKSTYRKKPNNSIIVNKKTVKSIQSLLALNGQLIKLEEEFRISFDKYIGFQAILPKRQLTINFGNDNFEKKYKQLLKILPSQNLKHIDLNYKGKAIIAKRPKSHTKVVK